VSATGSADGVDLDRDRQGFGRWLSLVPSNPAFAICLSRFHGGDAQTPPARRAGLRLCDGPKSPLTKALGEAQVGQYHRKKK